MDCIARLKRFAKRIDVFNLADFVPEIIADVGTKKHKNDNL